VNMITSANIGIGISGLEGQQAARAADYSIG
jgi:phospholipid-transporting ATPase